MRGWWLLVLLLVPSALADVTFGSGMVVDAGDVLFNFTSATTFDDFGIGSNSVTAGFGGDNQTLTITGTSVFYITSWTSGANSFTTTGTGTITAAATNNSVSGTTYYDGNIRSSWIGSGTPTSFRFTFSSLSTQADEETCAAIKFQSLTAMGRLFAFFSIIVSAVIMVVMMMLFYNGNVDEKTVYAVLSGTFITLVIVAILLGFGVSMIEESC